MLWASTSQAVMSLTVKALTESDAFWSVLCQCNILIDHIRSITRVEYHQLTIHFTTLMITTADVVKPSVSEDIKILRRGRDFLKRESKLHVNGKRQTSIQVENFSK